MVITVREIEVVDPFFKRHYFESRYQDYADQNGVVDRQDPQCTAVIILQDILR